MTPDRLTPNFHLVLLHDQMVDKQGKIVTTSLTMLDMHDIARSARTFGLRTVFVAHPAPTLRKLARVLKAHWEDGFGSVYNPNRKEALEYLQIVSDLDEAIAQIDLKCGALPRLIATSARSGAGRITFPALRREIFSSSTPFLLMLGTGWGMSDGLLARADFFLDPILGRGDYNHLSVRAACAILLDRLLAPENPDVECCRK